MHQIATEMFAFTTISNYKYNADFVTIFHELR